MIYATFEKSTASGNTIQSLYPYSYTELSNLAGYYYNVDGCTGWDLAETDSAGDTTYGSKVYTSPCGLGYIGQYFSPYGTMDAVDGRIFFCPGAVASFSTPGYMTDAFWYGNNLWGLPSVYIPRIHGASTAFTTPSSPTGTRASAAGGGTQTASQAGRALASPLRRVHRVPLRRTTAVATPSSPIPPTSTGLQRVLRLGEQQRHCLHQPVTTVRSVAINGGGYGTGSSRCGTAWTRGTAKVGCNVP